MRITPQALKTACASSQHVIETAKAIEVDPLLLASLIYHESRWQKTAVSNKKACGLTQVLAKYSPYSCTQLKKPKTSITEGAGILFFWLDKKTKPLHKALECYASGYRCKSPAYSKAVLNYHRLMKKTYKTIKQLMEKPNE